MGEYRVPMSEHITYNPHSSLSVVEISEELELHHALETPAN